MTTQTASTIDRRLVQVRPYEGHNVELVANVHPQDWVNPAPAEKYHMVVIGAGTAGLVTAAICANLGARTALIERDLMGGDCLNVGCVPSKAIIRCARAAHEARHADAFGIAIDGPVEVDFAEVMDRMRRLRASISKHDSVQRFSEMGIDVFLGEGRFTSTETIEVAGATLRFARACIATGARAAAPSIEGLEEAGYLTNESLFSLTQLPRRLAVLGGGPIGCEMAQAFARLGSEVHLIERGSHVLSREDAEAAAVVQQALKDDGVTLHLNASLTRVSRSKDGTRQATLSSDNDEQAIEVDEVLVATGRVPNIEDLALDEAGVAYDERTGVQVDDRFRTTNNRIYAAGDVCSRYQFTHAADFMARAVVRNALFFGREKLSDLVIPWCTYTQPEIAHVGRYPHELDEAGVAYETINVPLADNDRALLEGDTAGFLKVHYKRGSDVLLGATLVSNDAGNMIGELSLAMTSKIGLNSLSSTIHPYPTVAEIIRKAGDEHGRARLTPLVQRVIDLILRWRGR